MDVDVDVDVDVRVVVDVVVVLVGELVLVLVLLDVVEETIELDDVLVAVLDAVVLVVVDTVLLVEELMVVLDVDETVVGGCVGAAVGVGVLAPHVNGFLGMQSCVTARARAPRLAVPGRAAMMFNDDFPPRRGTVHAGTSGGCWVLEGQLPAAACTELPHNLQPYP